MDIPNEGTTGIFFLGGWGARKFAYRLTFKPIKNIFMTRPSVVDLCTEI
jgi:hypothetical protein